jgi:SAM-dependent methyltransferase
VPRSISDEQEGWGRQDSVEFFGTSRQGPESLYLSERLVLPSVASRASSVLDIGCAAGGFVSVFRHYNPAIRYVGIDIVHPLLRVAAESNPEADFVRNDGAMLPFADESQDLVWSSGILHVNSAYESIVRDAWRVAKRWLVCDFRLSLDGQPHVGGFDVDFGSGKPSTRLPYVVLPVETLTAFLSGLRPRPNAIAVTGYPHPVTPQAYDVPPEVIMAFAVLEKNGSSEWTPPSVDIRSRSELAASLDSARSS